MKEKDKDRVIEQMHDDGEKIVGDLMRKYGDKKSGGLGLVSMTFQVAGVDVGVIATNSSAKDFDPKNFSIERLQQSVVEGARSALIEAGHGEAVERYDNSNPSNVPHIKGKEIKVKMPKTEVKEDDDEELGLPNFVKENIDELAGKLSERGLGELLDMSTKMARSMGEVKTIELILDGVLEEVKHARDEGIHIDVSFMVNALHDTAKRLQKKATKRVAQVMKDLIDLG